MYFLRAILVFLLSCSLSVLYSTTPKDSLRQVLHTSKDDTSKVNLYNALSLNIYHSEMDTAIHYAESAIALAKKLNHPNGEARGRYMKGRILLEQSRNIECIEYFQEALDIYNNLEDVERFKGDTHMSLGRAYDMTGDYFNALDQFQKSIAFYEKVKYKKGVANCLVNIGIIHDRMKDHKKAKEYYKGAEDEYKLINDSTGLVYIYNNIGYIEFQLKNLEEAKGNYQIGIELAEQMKFDYMLPFLYNNLAGVYDELGSDEEAENIYKKAKAVSYRMNNRSGVVHSVMALASMNYKNENFDSYLKDMLTAYEESKVQGNKALIQETSKLLSEMYEFKGNKEKAHFYLLEAYAMQDSLNSSTLIQETSGLETQYRLEQQRRQEQVELEGRDRQIKYGALLFLCICGLLIGFLFLKNSQNKAKDELNTELVNKNKMLLDAEQILEVRNQELEKYIESNIQLEQFAHFASHDLKSPLRTIASFSDLLKKRLTDEDKLDEKTESYVKAVEISTKRMNALVVDLLDYSKVNSQVLNIEQFDFNEICEEVKQNLAFLINESKVNIKLQSEPLTMHGDRTKIKQVLENLLSNAIKFSVSVPEPSVELKAKEREYDYIFSIDDNGIGIDAKYYSRIFEPFKQLHTKNEFEGSGLGLAICKNIVEKHGGKIWINSELGHGTQMRFSIPKKS